MDQLNKDGVADNTRKLTQDEMVNNHVLSELQASGAERSITLFFENGQITNLVTNLDRAKLESKLLTGGRIGLDELAVPEGFKNGKVFVNLEKINIAIIRDKSNIVSARNSLIALK